MPGSGPGTGPDQVYRGDEQQYYLMICGGDLPEQKEEKERVVMEEKWLQK